MEKRPGYFQDQNARRRRGNRGNAGPTFARGNHIIGEVKMFHHRQSAERQMPDKTIAGWVTTGAQTGRLMQLTGLGDKIPDKVLQPLIELCQTEPVRGHPADSRIRKPVANQARESIM